MAAYNDGNVPFGAQVVTIGGVSFVAEDLQITDPSTIIERRDALGNPTGQVIITNFSNGTATLQYASTATTILTIGATFTITRNDSTTFSSVISQVGEPQKQTDAHKAAINWRKVY